MAHCLEQNLLRLQFILAQQHLDLELWVLLVRALHLFDIYHFYLFDYEENISHIDVVEWDFHFF
jgi:hypothetical protein